MDHTNQIEWVTTGSGNYIDGLIDGIYRARIYNEEDAVASATVKAYNGDKIGGSVCKDIDTAKAWCETMIADDMEKRCDEVLMSYTDFGLRCGSNAQQAGLGAANFVESSKYLHR